MVFRAKYDGVCCLCGYSFEKGENIKSVDVKYAHEDCTETEDFEPVSIREDYRSHYIKKGGKDHPVCKSCNVIHPPSQECW